MAAANTDNFCEVAVAGSETTLAAPGKSVGANSINITSASGWGSTTGTIFAMRRVDGSGNYVAGTYTEWAGVLSGTTLTINPTPLYGSDQTYAADGLTQVYIPVSASLWNRLVDTILKDHLQNGGHNNLHDVNNNIILALAAIASAVNQVSVSNNITGKNPSLNATGSDSNIGIDINSKGTGVSRIDGAAPKQMFQNAMYNFVESGCFWTADSPGSTLNASMTAGVVWIAGKRLTVAAITAHAFTASKDTYVDFQDNGDGTANVTYTAVTNNAASPAIPNSLTDDSNIRNAIIVTGASNIANSGSINQGQIGASLPIASSVPYETTDSLGIIICPRDPLRMTLGYRSITNALSTSSTTDTQVTGASITINVTSRMVGRKIRVRTGTLTMTNTTASVFVSPALYQGAVPGGTFLNRSYNIIPNASGFESTDLTAELTLTTTGAITFNLGCQVQANTGGINHYGGEYIKAEFV